MKSREHVRYLRSEITCIVVAAFVTVFAQVQTNTVTSLSTKTQNPQNASSVNSSAKCVKATMTEAESVMTLHEAAEGGNAEAQFELGKRYASGAGVATNSVEAAKWYLKAAKNGHVEAQLGLANYYLFGEGVTQDVGEALKWYRKAAIQGNVAAQEYLASIQHALTAEKRLRESQQKLAVSAKIVKVNFANKVRKKKQVEQREKLDVGLSVFLGACALFKSLWASARKRKGIRSLVFKITAVLGFALVLILPYYLENLAEKKREEARKLMEKLIEMNYDRRMLQDELKEKQQDDSYR